MKNKTSNSGTALVTGAASGLGYEFAKLLAKDAYRLILIDIDKDGLKVAEENLTGVTVTTICPGLTRTRFAETRAGFSRVKTPEPTILYDSSNRVAKIAYRAMLKGKAVSIPVFKNRVMTFLTWLAPRPIAVRFVRKSQNKFNKS